MDRNKFGVSATEMEISIKECLCHGIIIIKNLFFMHLCVCVCVGGVSELRDINSKWQDINCKKKSEIKS